ncbi:chorion peroxidase-like [Mytilus edulis]|uniref:chorion peroxidase-like n=1 Tax=Mytilus edulis TaxID=6550 RepID=UPI0039EF89C0
MEKISIRTFIMIILVIINSVESSSNHKCREETVCPQSARYRTFSGYCNNLRNPSWGQAGTAQRRLSDRYGKPMVAYEDGVSMPRGFPDRLPDPRVVSNAVSDSSFGPKHQSDRKRTGQHMSFGQLLAHDFIETDIPSDECFPFEIPYSDKRLPAGCKNFIRARAATNNVNLQVYREQINLISSYIDCSFLYGDGVDETLRVQNSFLMKTDPGNLLPTIDGGACLKLKTENRCPFAGDGRSTEAPNLSLNHLVFVRYHNRLSTQLYKLNPCWSNEMVFQETRRIIIAQVQHITYNHFLPLVVDRKTMQRFKLFSKKRGFNDVYDKKVDASSVNSFGIAPWRYGHSQIMAEQSELKDDFKTIITHKLEDNLESPDLWQTNFGERIEDLTRWLATKPAQKIDSFLVDGARDKLFFIKTPPGTDLYALNIQRGRDQGVPAYNEWRKFCGLRKFRSFDDFGVFGSKLAKVYKTVNDVDLFIGGLLEKEEDGGVGPTFAFLIGTQFFRFKVGDRFWYESSDPDFAFTKGSINNIKNGKREYVKGTTTRLKSRQQLKANNGS